MSTNHYSPTPLRRLWTLLQSESRELWIVVMFAIGVGILNLAIPIAVMAVVNTTALATLTQQLIVLCIGLLIALGLASCLRMLKNIVVEFIQRRIFVRVVNDLSFRLPRLNVAALDQEHAPELVNRFFDVLTVQKASAVLLLDGITLILQTFIGLILLGTYHEWLLGFDLFLIVGLIVLTLLGWGATATAIDESKAKYMVASWLEEIARHPVAFKLGGGSTYARQCADGLTQKYLTSRSRHFRIVMRQFGFALIMQALASVMLLAVGGYLVIQGQLSLGQLVAAELVVSLMVGTFTKIGKQLESYYDLLAAMDKLGHLMELPLENTAGASYHPPMPGTQVRFQNVCFEYHQGHHQVIESFTETIERGERVAIMGPHGVGKTTLIDMLFGLRLPQRGYIEVDGMDLRDLHLESYRQSVSLVKGIEIFAGTVLDNLRMGRESITMEAARSALQSVALLDDVLRLPQGLQTILGTGGTSLSLGQAERLMLARALVTRPTLLILDETLDDMDQAVRKQLVPVLFGPQAPWTLLVVTHSDEVAKLCQRCVRLSLPSITTRAK